MIYDGLCHYFIHIFVIDNLMREREFNASYNNGIHPEIVASKCFS